MGDLRVMYYAAPLSGKATLDVDVARILDVPLQVGVYPDSRTEADLRVRLNYTEDVLNPRSENGERVAEGDLVVVQRGADNVWRIADQQTRDTDLNWVASSLKLENGRAEVALALRGQPAPCSWSPRPTRSPGL